MKKLTALITGIILVAIFIITMFVLPPLLGWHYPDILSWEDFVDSISTVEGFVIGMITEVIPIICVTIGAIFLIIFVIKLIQGKE
ncbi:MAG: hypothetical protein HWN81_16875 [Candidatus Lokiarchaeota archaeon]|nr:hypothetical protein [Candidatus Lokiarchaeota archaeon]